ncbi:MAG TPA: acetyl-CoA carboxylase biotin carboxyl carrier protein [Terriglobales bacterium]|nr:acetyl-CoA carboxylase biotin carboxyl carrier protein [Terriglobales bacterium]
MNQKELKELIEFLIEKDIAEFELERGDIKVRIKRGGASSPIHYAAVAPVVSAPLVSAAPAVVVAAGGNSSPSSASAASSAEPAVEEAGGQIVHSPIVGTFYESPSPGAPPFVKPGDRVSLGQVLCIVEAMKLMNEIESDYAGIVVKRFVENGQPVEYGQQLFAIRPD